MTGWLTQHGAALREQHAQVEGEGAHTAQVGLVVAVAAVHARADG